MDFLAIDFETANEQPTSACELGLAVVRNYKIVESRSWLIRPPVMRFLPYNSMLHGINADDVAEVGHFSDLWFELKSYFENDLVVAHNAAFDMHVLRSLLLHYRIPFKPISFTDSIKVARKVWQDDIARYGLHSLTKYFGIELDHHSAASDAYACAEIASKAFREYQVSILEEIESKMQLIIGSISVEKMIHTTNKFFTLPKNISRKKLRRYNHF